MNVEQIKLDTIMKAEISKESYELVEKMAFKFAYGNTSYKYDELLNAGLEGLIKAVKTYDDSNDTKFSTYASTCIRNAMCTKNKMQERFDLTQDENVILDDIDTLATETSDDNMVNVTKRIILSANNNNERNAQMFIEHIGLNDTAPMDYKELSAKFNVSAERVRQVCVNTKREIKRNKNVTELLYSFVG